MTEDQLEESRLLAEKYRKSFSASEKALAESLTAALNHIEALWAAERDQ